MTLKSKLVLILAMSVAQFLCLKANAVATPQTATLDSAALVQAAADEIQISKANGNTETACSIYLFSVLNRAGFPVGSFVSNNFDQAMLRHLPNWQVAQFSTDNPGGDQQALRSFLNSAPDHTAFLAQWVRVGESGHVALIEKVSTDNYAIYQAQSGLSLPYSSRAQIQSLLYPKNQWGDRSHLRLFFE